MTASSDRRRDLPEWLEGRVAVGGVAAPDEHHDEGQPRHAAQPGRTGPAGCAIRNEIVESSSGAFAAIGTRLFSTSGRRRQEERAAKDGLDRVQLELEAGDDAEVAAAPADRPEEVRMVVRIGREWGRTIGRHDLDGLQRVDGEAVFADEEADTAAERQAARCQRSLCVLDLGAMKGLHIDPDRRLAWAQPGLTAREYTNAAAAHGLATPFGDTGSVGIAGLTLGGGIGWLARKYGLAVDALVVGRDRDRGRSRRDRQRGRRTGPGRCAAVAATSGW